MESKVVTAVGIIVGSQISGNAERAKRIERAQTEEIMRCLDDGLDLATDAVVVRQRMQGVTDRILNEDES